MKTRLLFAISVMLTSVSVFSQPYIPMLTGNPSWNIVVASFLGAQDYPTVEGSQVVIGGYTYTQFTDTYSNTIYALRENAAERKVYRRVNGVDQLLYDFNLANSDQITLANGFTYTANVGTVDVVGGTRKRILLYNDIAPNEVWIEGVGSNRHPFKPTYEFPSDPYVYTTCSAQNGVVVYNHGIANGQPTPTDCSMLKVDDFDFDQISFLPNPFNDEMKISNFQSFQNANLKLYNAAGMLVTELNALDGNEISLKRNNLPTGFYFMQISQKGIATTKKIVITD